MISRLVRVLFGWLLIWGLAACGSPAEIPSGPAEIATQPTDLPSPTTLPSPTPEPSATPVPTATVFPPRECLVGDWKLTDPEAFFRQALQANNSTAELVGVSGGLSYRFDSDGRMQILFSQLIVTLNTPVKDGHMLTRSMLDGSATAAYRLEGEDHLVLADFGSESVLLVIEVDGQSLVQTKLPAWASFFAAVSATSGSPQPASSAPQEVRAGFSCDAQQLLLRGEGLPVEMKLAR